MRRWFLLLMVVFSAGCDVTPSETPPQLTLLDAAERGDGAMIASLLGQQQAVDMRDACAFTPLMKATLNGHLAAVKQLVVSGAQVDLQDKGGYTALMLAASNNHVAIVDYLIQQGADVDHVENTNGWTALIWAANLGHVESVQLLLSHHANAALTDLAGLTAAAHALRQGHPEVGEVLSVL